MKGRESGASQSRCDGGSRVGSAIASQAHLEREGPLLEAIRVVLSGTSRSFLAALLTTDHLLAFTFASVKAVQGESKEHIPSGSDCRPRPQSLALARGTPREISPVRCRLFFERGAKPPELEREKSGMVRGGEMAEKWKETKK